jgi:type 1 glutamine amidotransferase
MMKKIHVIWKDWDGGHNETFEDSTEGLSRAQDLVAELTQRLETKNNNGMGDLVVIKGVEMKIEIVQRVSGVVLKEN